MGVHVPIHSRESVANQRVLARRPLHMRTARWLVRWQFPLQVAFAIAGLFLVLMPVLLDFWHEIIDEHAITAWVYEEFSRMGLVAVGWLVFLVCGPYLALHLMAQHYPGGWNVRQQWGFPSPTQIVERELYPRTLREECVFWVAMVMDVLGTSLWLYLPFGVLAFSLRPPL